MSSGKKKNNSRREPSQTHVSLESAPAVSPAPKSGQPHSLFNVGGLEDTVLSSFLATSFTDVPNDLDSVMFFLKERQAMMTSNYVSRPTTETVTPEYEDVRELQMPSSVVCPRFDEIDIVGDTVDVMSFLEPSFLKSSDAQFARNMLPTDVVDNLGMDVVRKKATFHALDKALDSFAKKNLKPNVIHHCDASYVPQLLLRFHGRGVGHVVFLHPSTNILNANYSLWDDSDLPSVDFTYSFMYGSVTSFVEFVLKQNIYNATIGQLRMEPDYEMLVQSVARDADPNITLAEAYGMGNPGYVPTMYHVYFSMHNYDLIRTQSINELSSILDADCGVGIVALVSPGCLVNPVTAALNGYTLLGRHGSCVTIYDTFTSKVYHEYLFKASRVARWFFNAGAVFGLVTGSFFPGVEIQTFSHFDTSFAVYGFHFHKPLPFALPPSSNWGGTFEWSSYEYGSPSRVRFNTPTQASLWDVTNMTEAWYAPKANGYTAILHVDRDFTTILFGPHRFSAATPLVVCSNITPVAFQIELMLLRNGKLCDEAMDHDFFVKNFPIFTYKVVDLLGKYARHLPFFCKWTLCHAFFAYNTSALQEYSEDWISSDEGCVIQPVLHVSTETVKMGEEGGTEIRSHAKSVKHYKVDDDYEIGSDFCVSLPHKIADGIDTESKIHEVEVFSHNGRFHMREVRVRPDRKFESLSKVPNNIADYKQFRSAVFAKFIWKGDSNKPLNFAVYKFQRLLHCMIVNSIRGLDPHPSEWEYLVGLKSLAKCDHQKFANGCVVCEFARGSAKMFPQVEMTRRMTTVHGFALPKVRDEYYGTKPVRDFAYDGDEGIVDF
jgi:hypothetical protein